MWKKLVCGAIKDKEDVELKWTFAEKSITINSYAHDQCLFNGNIFYIEEVLEEIQKIPANPDVIKVNDELIKLYEGRIYER